MGSGSLRFIDFGLRSAVGCFKLLDFDVIYLLCVGCAVKAAPPLHIVDRGVHQAGRLSTAGRISFHLPSKLFQGRDKYSPK